VSFALAVAAVGLVAGGIASLSGFGIGSLLTPLLAARLGTKVAVAAVAIPHVAGTALRLWTLRRHIDRRIALSFGVTSAAGGLVGALAHAVVPSKGLALVLGVLLLFAGVTGLTGVSERMRFGRRMAWVGGAVSGLLGGLVGNQGGIRSAAMLGFHVPRHAFIATATTIALAVDAVRMPVYLATQVREIADAWHLVVIATAAVMVGTVVGARILSRVDEATFRYVVSSLITALGVVMVVVGR
jgi:uncharacterized protein